VGLLARHFWDTLGGKSLPVPSESFDRWEGEPWPGNVRELENAVARLLALGDLSETVWPSAGSRTDAGLEADDEPRDHVAEVIAMNLPFPRARQRILERFERAYVARALAEHGGNVTRAAAASGIARRYLNMIRARARDPQEEP